MFKKQHIHVCNYPLQLAKFIYKHDKAVGMTDADDTKDEYLTKKRNLLIKFSKSHPDWYKQDCRTNQELSRKIKRWEIRLLKHVELYKDDPDLLFLAKRRVLAMKMVILRVNNKAKLQLFYSPEPSQIL